MLYTTACCNAGKPTDDSFLPLTINYSERFSAAGRTRWVEHAMQEQTCMVCTMHADCRLRLHTHRPGQCCILWGARHFRCCMPQPLLCSCIEHLYSHRLACELCARHLSHASAQWRPCDAPRAAVMADGTSPMLLLRCLTHSCMAPALQWWLLQARWTPQRPRGLDS